MSILKDDFLTYVGRHAPKEGLTEVTRLRFCSLRVNYWYKDVGVRMGNDVNLFSCRDLKVILLRMIILFSVPLENCQRTS